MDSPPVEAEEWEQTNSEQFWLALGSKSDVRKNKTMGELQYSGGPKHHMNMSRNNNQESEF